MANVLESAAGKILLQLSSRGNSIIAELLRLIDHIPRQFYSPQTKKTKQNPNPTPYHLIIFDFKYLTTSELYETRIENSVQLIELDTEFREQHSEIISRFYMLFESCYKYVSDFLKFLEELDEGLFIQQTLESVVLDSDGKQLIAEVLYLYGAILLMMDVKVPGIVRERLLVSYMRYKGTSDIPLVDQVCHLCKRTARVYAPGAKQQPGYPAKYFARYPIPQNVVKMIIARLRSDDVYSQTICYPLPEHRSVMLSTQARMLYVILYFAPAILHKEKAIMREVVDKHFSDNWIIAYYLGFTADLSVEWMAYPAARIALENTLGLDNVRRLKSRYWQSVPTLLQTVKKYLTEGVLTEEYVLVHHAKLMSCLREANITARWLLLHSISGVKKIREILIQGFNPSAILVLLLYTSQLEFVLKQWFEKLLASKDKRWEECREKSTTRMTDLSEYFSGDKPLTNVEKNENLQNWFAQISSKIDDLDYQDYVAAGRKIQQLIRALEEVEQFQHIASSLQVRVFLDETREFLNRMLRFVNVKNQYLATMDTVSDLSYGWEILKSKRYVSLMQERIKADPRSTVMLRSLFLKLKSILDWPLMRIIQSSSSDIFSVSKFYSAELVGFVRDVLDVVPKTMFKALNTIIQIQTSKLRMLPTKLEKAELRDYAQLEQRYGLAKATWEVAVFTEGILAMETTLVGIIEIEPKKMLEEGIRKELVYQLASTMDKILVFRSTNVTEFEKSLRTLSATLNGFRRSFQYIQDYAGIYGLKIWQEEFSRIVNFNVERECNSFLKNKIYDSQYQNSTIPIPIFNRVDRASVNFIGRLGRALLLHTNPVQTIFVDQMSAWYTKSGKELVGIRTFDLLLRSVGVFGVTGLDKLLCFMIVKEMQTFIAKIRKLLDANVKKYIQGFTRKLSPTTVLPTDSDNLYRAGCGSLARLWPLFLEVIPRIGQMQLLRRQIANTLNFITKLDSTMLGRAIKVTNDSLLQDIKEHYSKPDEKPYPSEDNPILYELAKFLQVTGLHEPFTKIYVTTDPLDGLPVLMFLFTLSQLPKFQYVKKLQTLMCPPKQKGAVDSTPLVVGVLTMLKQFHSVYTQKYLAYMGQYVRGMINVDLNAGKNQKKKKRKGATADYSDDVINVLLFLESFCNFGKLSRKVVEGYLPAYIFDNFRH